MAAKIPLKANFSGADPISIGEFEAGDVVDEASGGTGTTAGVTGFKNRLINGNFDFWQRGTSLAAASTARYLADRWSTSGAGSTGAISRQAFTVGQTDVPGNPSFFHRVVVASSAGAGNYFQLQQKLEGVQTDSGTTVTLSFYAKADAAKPMAVEFAQVFGSGGSASVLGDDASWGGLGAQKVNLTTAWQKFTVTANVPSVAGKTIGTDSSIRAIFWFDAGSNFNGRTDTLGQQSGTFDIARVQWEKGPNATEFDERPLGLELVLCQRYFEKSFDVATAPAQSAGITGAHTWNQATSSGAATTAPSAVFKTRKRVSGSLITLFNPSAANAEVRNIDQALDCTGSAANVVSESSFFLSYTTAAGSAVSARQAVQWTSDAEL